jgi:TonB family protein
MRTRTKGIDFHTFLVVCWLAMAIMGLSHFAPTHGQEIGDQPAVITAVAPNYPPIAFSAGITGDVVVEVSIDNEGVVKSAHVVEGHRLLRDDSERMARQWLFARSSGRGPVRKVKLVFGFSILPAKGTSAKPGVVFKLPYRVEITRAMTSEDETRIRHVPAKVRNK